MNDICHERGFVFIVPFLFCVMATAFVLFGSTGDLVKKKVLPALVSLSAPAVTVIAVGRKEFSTQQYRDFIGLSDDALLDLQYVQADVSESESLIALSTVLHAYDTRIFYVATGYTFFTPIVAGIERFGLHICDDVKVVFEKPFGVDGLSARTLDARLKQVFTEEQLFRIDHYLAKEQVHALVKRKMTDQVFEERLFAGHVAKITLRAHESAGVGERLSYYHTTGALKDMIQNHLLQVLSLILLKTPRVEDAETMHDAKDAVLESLSLGKPEEQRLGQYASYPSEVQKAGLPARATETFARVTVYSSLPRWEGVPLVLETGKKMPERYAAIIILYRDGSEEKMVINPLGETKHGDGYAFLLQELLQGKREWFAREDEILEGWRLVDELERMKQTIRFTLYPDGMLPL